MYRLNKGALSGFIRGECSRRLRLDIYSGVKARRDANAPEKTSGRPGLDLIVKEGRDYEKRCFASLEDTFGSAKVKHGAPVPPSRAAKEAFETMMLGECIEHLSTAGNFALEAQYPVVRGFVLAHGLEDLTDKKVGDEPLLAFGENRPDILQSMAPGGIPRRSISPDGEIIEIAADDARLGLRITDIKLSSEPSPAHFAELAYYGMTLAAWLEAQKLDNRFIVLADAAIWPGSHDGSAIRRLQADEHRRGQQFPDINLYYSALEQDLETMPAEVILGRVIQFFSADLRGNLAEQNWDDLPLHIDSRCIGCDYLGYSWKSQPSAAGVTAVPDPRLCWPKAERTNHLSRIAGLTEGACGKLVQAGKASVADISALQPGSPVFESHQALRATRHVVQARAKSLINDAPANLPVRSGTSAVMPSFSDVRVALSVDYDVGSGLTFALGYQVDARVPIGVRKDDQGQVELDAWNRPKLTNEVVRRPRQMLVTEKTVDGEGQKFSEFLARLQGDIFDLRDRITAGMAEHRPGGDKPYKPSIQFYLWDMLNFEQLCKMMGRHLLRIRAPQLRDGKSVDSSPMAWIFPPDELLPDADNVDRNSPITIVSDMVRLLAAGIPHHYGQIAIANAYPPKRSDDKKPFTFWINPFYGDPLSDQIPSERGHEIWQEESPFKSKTSDEYREDIRKAVGKRIEATLSVVDRLKQDLQDDPSTKLTSKAPAIEKVFGRGNRLSGVGQDLQIIFQHARLMNAAQALEVDLLMSTPPFEREARFQSVRLEHLYEGEDRTTELKRLDLVGLIRHPSVFAFRMSARSREAKIATGDFNRSLMPEDRLDWQHLSMSQLLEKIPGLNGIDDRMLGRKVRGECSVKILSFDRVNGTVVVEASPLLTDLVQMGHFDMRFKPGHYGIIDPVHVDYFVGPRLKPALEAIGNPQVARDEPLADAQNLIRSGHARPRVTATASAAADLLWRAEALHLEQTRGNASAGMATLPQLVKDNASQVSGIEHSLTHRLSLLWGPPGTGKSETSAALLRALIEQSHSEGRGVRIAVTGPTWVAIDNVLRKLPPRLRGLDVDLARLLSPKSPVSGVDDLLRDYVVTPATTDSRTHDLLDRLRSGKTTIVGSTAHQLGQLAKVSDSELPELFDFMLVDEASQMDVAQAIVAFRTLAAGASVTVVGDHMQMAPIHPIDPPVGFEHVVGSIYDFFKQYRKGQPGRTSIAANMLNVSYRSNREIVEFVSSAGYPGLTSAFPDLRMSLRSPLPASRPLGLDSQMPWSADIAKVLDPEEPLSVVIHSDRYSSQRNDGEARLVASLVAALAGRLENGKGELLTGADLFTHGIGIVTPHRAQQAAVIECIRTAIDPDAETTEAMMRSVDTVERFQGQEKIVMLASFGLGDGDQIAQEEEFLYDLNRFNVIASRAKAKLIVIMSRRLVDYLPRDLTALRGSRLLKHLAYGHLRTATSVLFPEVANDLGECELMTK